MFRSAKPCALLLIAALMLPCATVAESHSAPVALAIRLSQESGAVKAGCSPHTSSLAQTTDTLAVAPQEIVLALPLAQTATQTLQVTNTGATEVHLYLDAANRGDPSTTVLGATPPYRLLVVTPDTDANLAALRSVLDGLADVTWTVWDSTAGTPSSSDLLPYDVVLVGNATLWQSAGLSPAALSQALAGYIELGGKVIETLLVAQATDWGLSGPYFDRGHAPLLPAATLLPGPLQVTVIDAEHALAAGLNDMTPSQALNTSARPGVSVPAVFAGTDVPYVAATDDVVAINQQLCHGNWASSDLDALLQAAIIWLCGERAAWLRVEPSEANLAPGETLDATVQIDLAAALTPRVYRGEIRLVSGDSTLSMLAVPVEAAALVDLSTGRLSGTITSDLPGGPLMGVEVSARAGAAGPHIDTTDARGAYSLWLSPGDYTVTFSRLGYAQQHETVHLSSQERMVVDVAMVYATPRLRISPERVVIEAPGVHTIVGVIANDGAGVLSFELDTAGRPWIDIEPSSGTVAAGDSVPLLLRLDTALAQPGWNVAQLAISTNDTTQSPAALWVYLKVGQAVMLPLLLGSP